jgi:predicted phosphodiesterase
VEFAALTVLLYVSSIPAVPVRFAIIGDRTGGHQEGVYGQIISAVEREKPEFVITVGDQIEGYTEDTTTLNRQWQEYKSIVSGLSMPLHLVPGNHDISTNSQLGPYLANAGLPYYSFDHKGMHFVVLDASRWESSAELPSEQLEWLAADLSKAGDARQTFVFYHRPFWYGTTTDGRPDTLHRLFVKYGVDAVFSGHLHQYFGGTCDGIKYTVVGSSGGGAEPGPTGILYHWAMVTADDEDLTIVPVLLDGERRRWDDVTVEDMRTIARSEFTGLRFAAPVVAGPDLKARGAATLIVTNLSSIETLEDSVRWYVPEGWSVLPAKAAVSCAPDSSVSMTFKVQSSGRLFPVPAASLPMAYAAGKSTLVERRLQVVRMCGAVEADAPPLIDGRPIETCWRNPVRRLLAADGGPARTDSTRFHFAYDSADLYLAAVCFDPAVSTVKTGAQKRDDAVQNDDCVDYFLQPDTGMGDVFEVCISASGTVFDQMIHVSPNGDLGMNPAWDHNHEIQTFFGQGFWSIEVRIPLPTELLMPRPGDVWGLNFRRNQPGRKESADWQPIDYDPDTFGLMLFE